MELIKFFKENNFNSVTEGIEKLKSDLDLTLFKVDDLVLEF